MAAFLLAALAATPFLDGPALGRFETYCQEKVAATSCKCVADELQGSAEGRAMIEAVAALRLPEAQRRAAMLNVLNRYGLKASELRAILDAAPERFKGMEARCG